ncbi:MAG: TRAP transporter small permease [Ramlibacter sp.]|nr:TRAP transporter small permease [Ramlibacter sp.]
MQILEILAKACAMLAGLLLSSMVILSCGSIIGRETIGKTITGDFELVGLATGAAVGLFMPLCQLHRGNIVVDVFTSRAPEAFNAVIERIGALLLGLCCGLLAWRAALGGLSSFNSNSSTMLLGVPEWIAYAPMVPGFALTAVIAMWQAAVGYQQRAHHPGDEA